MILMKSKLIDLYALLKLPYSTKDNIIVSVVDLILDIVSNMAYDIIIIINIINNVKKINFLILAIISKIIEFSSFVYLILCINFIGLLKIKNYL